MQQLPSSGAVASFAAEKDRLPKNATGVKMRVKARVPTILPGGHVAQEGECIVTVPTRDQYSSNLVQQVQDMAWGEDEPVRIEEARKAFERIIDRETQRATGVKDLATIQDVRKRVDFIAGRSDHELSLAAAAVQKDETLSPEQKSKQLMMLSPLTNEEKLILETRAKVYEETGSSVEACFYEQNERGIKPLISAEIIEESVAIPEHEEARSDDDKLFQTMMKAFQAMQQVSQDKRMAELEARIVELQEQVTAPKKK